MRIVSHNFPQPTLPQAANVPGRFTPPPDPNDDKREMPDFGERVAKYIPGEVIAGYMALLNLLATMTKDSDMRLRTVLAVIAVLAGIVVTPLYLLQFNAPRRDKRRHIIVAIVAFVVWAYAFPIGAFVEYDIYHPVVASFILILFTLGSGAIKPKS